MNYIFQQYANSFRGVKKNFFVQQKEDLPRSIWDFGFVDNECREIE